MKTLMPSPTASQTTLISAQKTLSQRKTYGASPTITSGHFKGKKGVTACADQGWANKLNLVFNRFDSRPTTSPTPQLPSAEPPYTVPALSWQGTLLGPHPTPITPTQNNNSAIPHHTQICLTADQVKSQLKTKIRKATGPDGISFRLLRTVQISSVRWPSISLT